MNNNVFHIVIWTENETSVNFSLGLEGAIATRALADEMAEAYRAGFAVLNKLDPWVHRVGVLEISAADPRLNHEPPLTDISPLVIAMRKKIAIRQAEQAEAEEHCVECGGIMTVADPHYSCAAAMEARRS